MPEDDGGDEDESGKTATFPFLNRLFGGSQTRRKSRAGINPAKAGRPRAADREKTQVFG